MFGYNYRIETVNPDKGIVKLAPTAGTYAKAFAPVVIIWTVLLGAGALLNYQDRRSAAMDSFLNDEPDES